MAEKPVTQNLPANLPENWTEGQIISPGGTEAGLDQQHGYNYLMSQVNNAQKAIKEINDAFENLAELDAEGKVPSEQLPAMNYQPKTETLEVSSTLAMNDAVPVYDTSEQKSKRITIQTLKSALGVQSPTLNVTALAGTSLVVTDGTTTLNGTGTTSFSLPNVGTWTITATLGGEEAEQEVEVTGALLYSVDMRIASSIAITTPPTKTSYIVGDTFQPDGVVITATFADDTTADVSEDATYSPTVMAEGVSQVTFSVVIGGQTLTANQAVTVDRIALTAVPSQSNTLTYNGTAQSPTFNNYETDKMTISGTQSATNAGTYQVSFTPGAKYKWPDGTTSAKTVNWSIGKATGSLSLSSNSVTVNNSSPTAQVTATRSGTGAVSASASPSGIVNVSVSGNTITITGVATGSATVTVNVAADTNYTAPSSQTIAVDCSMISPTLADNTWADISAISSANQGANYWDVGDTKSVTLNGSLVGTAYNNKKIDAFILGFNHNSSREGTGRIHFQLGKIGQVQVALCDANYSSTGSSAGFRMNLSNTNSGGWNNSYMRKNVLGNSGTPSSPPANSLLAVVEAGLRNALKSVNKWTDNTGNSSNSSGNVTSTTDYFFLLAEFEVFGSRGGANQYEQNQQAQYDFYKSGNAKIRYRDTATSTAVWWWLRSPYCYDSNHFLIVRNNGDWLYSNARSSGGLAPGFCV